MSIIVLNDDNFAASTASGKVMIDFYADWCGPCKMMAPIVDEIAEMGIEGLTVAKVNVDDSPETARKFGIMSIPTIVVLENGEEKDRSIGLKNKAGLLALIG